MATPIVIMVATSKGAQMGILVKDAQSLERARKINTLVIDKTGTITEGKLSLEQIEKHGDKDLRELLSYAATLALHSSHPISESIYKEAKSKRVELLEVSDFYEQEGKGVLGHIDGKSYRLGSEDFLKESNIEINSAQGEGSKVFISEENSHIGTFFLTDPVKKSSKEAIDLLREKGIHVVMMSGDRKEVAESVGAKVGVDEVFAPVKPEDKAQFVKELKREGKITGMVGDGVNDAPALAEADIGFAIGTGTDVAMESASIGLMKGDITSVVKAFELSRQSVRKIYQNLFFAFFYNILGIPLAAFGLLNPMIAGAAMALSSVSVVFNAILLGKKRIAPSHLN